MNAITLTITTMTLGVMVGITGTHFNHVQSMVDRGVPAQAVPIYQPVDGAPIPELRGMELAQPSKTMPTTAPMIANASYLPSEQDKYYEAKFQAFEMKQRQLIRQLAEANRDVSELTFRVDSHSDSFKPLQSGSIRPRTLDSAANPVDGGMGVLPPKQ